MNVLRDLMAILTFSIFPFALAAATRDWLSTHCIHFSLSCSFSIIRHRRHRRRCDYSFTISRMSDAKRKSRCSALCLAQALCECGWHKCTTPAHWRVTRVWCVKWFYFHFAGGKSHHTLHFATDVHIEWYATGDMRMPSAQHINTRERNDQKTNPTCRNVCVGRRKKKHPTRCHFCSLTTFYHVIFNPKANSVAST